MGNTSPRTERFPDGGDLNLKAREQKSRGLDIHSREFIIKNYFINQESKYTSKETLSLLKLSIPVDHSFKTIPKYSFGMIPKLFIQRKYSFK